MAAPGITGGGLVNAVIYKMKRSFLPVSGGENSRISLKIAASWYGSFSSYFTTSR